MICSHIFWYWYYAAYLYKCAIHNVLFYEDLYCQFVSNLQGKQSLIRNSAKFKTQFFSASVFCIVLVHHCLRWCQELYYLFILFIPQPILTTHSHTQLMHSSMLLLMWNTRFSNCVGVHGMLIWRLARRHQCTHVRAYRALMYLQVNEGDRNTYSATTWNIH